MARKWASRQRCDSCVSDHSAVGCESPLTGVRDPARPASITPRRISQANDCRRRHRNPQRFADSLRVLSFCLSFALPTGGGGCPEAARAITPTQPSARACHPFFGWGILGLVVLCCFFIVFFWVFFLFPKTESSRRRAIVFSPAFFDGWGNRGKARCWKSRRRHTIGLIR